MTQRILVMGLPGAGKTYFAKFLKKYIEEKTSSKVFWFNADDIRKKYNDWDFSIEGRIRQSLRMRELADSADYDFVICDFVAPLIEMRKNFDANWTIWIDTIVQGRFEDTNNMFEPPSKYDFRIVEKNAEKIAQQVAEQIITERRLCES